MKKLLTLLAAFSIVLTLQAESPEKISYQAIIRNTKGELVKNQSIGMKISIYFYNKTMPVTSYAETHTPTTNENGLVSIEIGTGKVVTGVFADLDWAAKAYYLKTEIDPGGRTSYSITSDTQILSVPYALHAKTSSEIPDNSVSSAKIADGAVSAAKLGQSGATTDQVWKWNGTQWAPASDNTGGWTPAGTSDIYTVKEVGIKTNNPQFPLDVYGTINCGVPGSVYSNPDPLMYNGTDIILEVRDREVDGDRQFVWGGFNPRFSHVFDSPVGINCIPGKDNMLCVNGNAAKPGGGTWSTFSDMRLKNVQGSYEKGLTEIVQLEPIWFTYKEGNEQQLPTSIQQTGFIAQEVLKVFPEAVREDSKGFLQFDMHPVLVSFVNGFKELKIENDILKTENEFIKLRLEKLEKLILSK